jgi:hypothetical protein
MVISDTSDLIVSGERSRLIPVVADMSREERAISPVLAAFAIVPALAHSMLQDVGGPTNQRAKIRSFSQIVFKGAPSDRKLRPDGLLEVDSGRKIWRAIIEAKIGGAELSAEQIEMYLDLARQMKIDALITVSNQFATVPTHHPVAVNKQKLRNVKLFHFSWQAILTKARLISDDKGVHDPEQAFILKELIRYLSHESSGVLAITRLGKEWKQVCTKIHTGTPISKADRDTAAVVSQWHQLTRCLALELSTSIGKLVDVRLARSHTKDPGQRLMHECDHFAASPVLRVDLGIPNAVSPLTFEADFLRRSLRFSISLNTPQDKVRPTAAVNWVTRQLAPYPGSMDTLVRVHWPGRTADTVAPLAEAIVDPKAVAPDDRKTLPTGFEIQRVVDLAGRFKGSSTFIEDARREIPRFYKDVVQNVANWVPKAPKYKERTSDEVDEGEPKRGAEELAEDRTSPVSATDPEASTEMGVPDGVALQRE